MPRRHGARIPRGGRGGQILTKERDPGVNEGRAVLGYGVSSSLPAWSFALSCRTRRLAVGLRCAPRLSCLGLASLLLVGCAGPSAHPTSDDPDERSDDHAGDRSDTDASRGELAESKPRDAGVRDAHAVETSARRADAEATRPDASDSETGDGCKLGEAGSFATDDSLDLFGQTTFFAKGTALPAGRYRVSYLDGCMKYNAFLPWTVNQSSPPSGWWLVGARTSDQIALLPGTVSSDFFGSFEACVNASKSVPAVEFDFVGGKLGLWLDDAPYQDNTAGENGRNPKWQLTLLVKECPPDLVFI